MSMRIRTHGVFLSYELEYLVRTKVVRALNRFLTSVHSVDVLLAVESGASDGADKVCKLAVQLGKGVITIGCGTHRSIEGAVCLATGKLARSVARACSRHRRGRRDRNVPFQPSDGVTTTDE